MSLKFINPRRQWLGAFVPNWLLERSEITQGAKLCYARLCQFWNEKKGYAWPRQTTLASSLGIKERQLRTYLAELEGCKLVDVSQPGLRRPNEYRFLYHPWMADDQEPLQVVVDRQKTATPDRQDTATQDRTYTATPISRESVQENHTRESVSTKALSRRKTKGQLVAQSQQKWLASLPDNPELGAAIGALAAGMKMR